MGELLERRLHQTKFEGPHHEALLGLLVAHAEVESMIDAAFQGTGLTQPQYNVLRILNGKYPDAYPRGEIAERMVKRAPDLTRMIDRLVGMGYVERTKGERDHRQSLTRITAEGRALLDQLRPKAQHISQILAERITAHEAQQLTQLLEKIYGND